MVDLTDQQAAQTIKITGANSVGLETNYADVDANGNALNTPISRTLLASGSASALNADAIASTDLQGYQSASIQVTGTFVGTLTFQGSNNNVNFVPVLVTDTSVYGSIPFTSTATTGLFYAPLTFRYLRIRMTAYTSGTATATVVYDSMTPTDLGARKVDANLSSGQLVPTITNKLRMPLNISNVTVVAAYTSLFSRSGTGLFFGFQAAFNNANVRIKLTVDGGIVFENTLAEFQSFQFNDTTTTRTQAGAFVTTIGNTLDFSTRYAIPYGSSVDISVQRSDTSNHVNSNWIVFLTEDT